MVDLSIVMWQFTMSGNLWQSMGIRDHRIMQWWISAAENTAQLTSPLPSLVVERFRPAEARFVPRHRETHSEKISIKIPSESHEDGAPQL